MACLENSCLLPKEILNAPSPSQLDGISSTIEKTQKIFGCELIQEACILMKFSVVVSATAQNLFHRFYFRKSLSRYDPFFMSMACLLVSSKVEEELKALREFILIYNRMYQRRRCLEIVTLSLSSVRYSEWKDKLIRNEMVLLKELGFAFYHVMDHPQKYILYFVKLLNGTTELAQLSWNYLSDSMRLDLALRYSPTAITCAAILMAARRLRFALPSPMWWKLMASNYEEVKNIAEQILELYHYPKMTWLDPITIDSPFSAEDLSQDRRPLPVTAKIFTSIDRSKESPSETTDSLLESAHQTQAIDQKERRNYGGSGSGITDERLDSATIRSQSSGNIDQSTNYNRCRSKSRSRDRRKRSRSSTRRKRDNHRHSNRSRSRSRSSSYHRDYKNRKY